MAKPRSKRPSLSRVGLTEAAWQQIAPLLPKNGRKGKKWRDHRRVIDGILWLYRVQPTTGKQASSEFSDPL